MYRIQTVKDPDSTRVSDSTRGEADELPGAMNAARELSDYTGSKTEIYDEADGDRLVAIYHGFEWVDE
jgi:hypothetical protein